MSETYETQSDLKESVHKIWLAGLGALAAAGDESWKVFHHLVEKGEELESRGKERFDGVKSDVESKVEGAKEQAKDRAGSTWEGFEERLDDVVSAALGRLGVPTRDEIATLTKRVAELTAVVEKLRPAKPPAAKAKTARKTAAKTSTKAAG